MRFLKSLFCKHDYSISSVDALEREGTMIVHIFCKKCKQLMDTLHDLTETEEIQFRNSTVENLLKKEGYLVKKNKKVYLKINK